MSRITVWKIKRKYAAGGDEALRDHKPGRLFESLNHKFYTRVIDEWPISNFMWHTDWHTMKGAKLRGKEFISYLDDSSRQIMSYGLFDSATTRNSLLILYAAIARHKVAPYELNSDRGSQFIPNKFDKYGKANSEFQEALQELGVLFIPSRTRHPQTNGKIEKFHDILEKEFDDRFATLYDFIGWYNNERASEAIDYLNPKEAYKKRL